VVKLGFAVALTRLVSLAATRLALATPDAHAPQGPALPGAWVVAPWCAASAA